MLNNDLSNDPSPSVYIVWEGLIATCADEKKFKWHMKTRRYAKALALFETQELAVSAMWQAMMYSPYGVAVVTFLPEPLTALLRARLDEEVVPCRHLLATTPTELVRRLPYMPWLAVVADPVQFRASAYGSFGRYVPPEHSEILGRLI